MAKLDKPETNGGDPNGDWLMLATIMSVGLIGTVATVFTRPGVIDFLYNLPLLLK